MDTAGSPSAPPASRRPWQPITFGGVAGFAAATWRRLFWFQLTVALAAALCVTLTALRVWLPGVNQAIENLPEGGYIRWGQLAWPTPEPALLTETPYLSVVVTPVGDNPFGLTADVQVEIRPTSLRIHSLLGYVVWSYTEGTHVALNHPTVKPWWGARKPFLVLGLFVAAGLGLLGTWALLASVYAPAVKLLALLGGRPLDWPSAWRLAAASLLPPAVFFSVAILGYGLGQLPLVGLLFAGLLHVVLAWVYVLIAPFRLPRGAAPELPGLAQPAANPFTSTPDQAAGPSSNAPAKNPFAPPPG